MRHPAPCFKLRHVRASSVGQGGTLRVPMPSLHRHVFVCVNERAPDNPKGCCKAKGSVEVRDRLKAELSARGLSKLIRANNAGCLDQCEHGVTVVIYPEQVWYGHVTVDDIPEIVDKHLIGGEVVTRLLLPDQPHLGERTAFPVLQRGTATR
jgi:(2Fe-2S) ferredoxin